MPWFDSLIPADPAQLSLLDGFLHSLHLGMVVFVLTGWIFRRLRKAHLITLAAIWFSWVAIGLYVGHIGYCVITDWHWQVKDRLREWPLPASYIEYLYWRAGGGDADDRLTSRITGSVFVLVTLVSAALNWRGGRKRKTGKAPQ